MGVDRVGDGQPRTPILKAIPGGRPERSKAVPAAPTERAEGVPDGEGAISPEVVRRAKVAEARIKIMNGYYARRDVQRRLAERLALELR